MAPAWPHTWVCAAWFTLAVGVSMAHVSHASAQAPAQPPAQVQPPTQGATYVGLREGHVDVPGARLFFADSGGAGVPVVFLHPGTGSMRIWEHQVPAIVQAGYRFIAYDRRGYGRTTVEPGGPVSTGPDDLDALVAALGIDRFHLVGSAAGGMVALDYAASFPRRLRSLTIANSLGGGDDPEYRAMLRRLLPPQFNPLPPDFKELSPSYRAANPEGTTRWLDLEHLSRAPGPRPPAQPTRSQMTAERLRTLGVAAQFLTGEADLYSPPPLMKLFADKVPGARLVTFREAGHSAYWEVPDAFNRTVIEFLRSH